MRCGLRPAANEREEAVRWLGRLRDERALEPLINLLPEARTRHLVVVAMGELGDKRAFTPLSQVLRLGPQHQVRDGVVRGLGMLGDARALDSVVALASEDAELRNTGESLVRLHALERQRIGGTDVTTAYAGRFGFGACYEGPLRHDWDYCIAPRAPRASPPSRCSCWYHPSSRTPLMVRSLC